MSPAERHFPTRYRSFRRNEREARKTALHALTAQGKNATPPNVNQEKLKAVMRGLETGELRHPRFTREEFAASKGTQHEQLWNYILSLESSDMDGGGAEALDRGKGKADPQGGGRLGRLRRVATRYESDPGEVASGDHKYFDRGAESRVYDAGDGTVLKVRRLDAYDIDGVKHALAKIVYHNYLFPKDAYTLHDIGVWENSNGFDEYYLLLEQPFVTPLRDVNGNIIAPSEGHILQALRKTGREFRVTGGYYDNGDASPESGSHETVDCAKMIAACDDYIVYDFKPGRNTFLDAETGEVRFIDPRVDINDPTDNFAYSRFGRRRRTDAVFDIDRQTGNPRPPINAETEWTTEDEERLREQEEAESALEELDSD